MGCLGPDTLQGGSAPYLMQRQQPDSSDATSTPSSWRVLKLTFDLNLCGLLGCLPVEPSTNLSDRRHFTPALWHCEAVVKEIVGLPRSSDWSERSVYECVCVCACKSAAARWTARRSRLSPPGLTNWWREDYQELRLQTHSRQSPNHCLSRSATEKQRLANLSSSFMCPQKQKQHRNQTAFNYQLATFFSRTCKEGNPMLPVEVCFFAASSASKGEDQVINFKRRYDLECTRTHPPPI